MIDEAMACHTDAEQAFVVALSQKDRQRLESLLRTLLIAVDRT